MPADRIAALEAALEASREETRASFANRALMYAYIFEAAEDELGTERAVSMMKRAIHRRGVEVGQQYREAADAGDLAEVARIFVEGSPAAGELFSPGVEVLDVDGRRVVLRMNTCPLVEAWRDAGYSDERVDLLCEIAAEVDEGTFEGAGLGLRFLERQPQAHGCRCLLELTLRD